MTIQIYASPNAQAIYQGNLSITGVFIAASAISIRILTKDFGLMSIPIADIEYFEDTEITCVIEVLKHMRNFNTTSKVAIDLISTIS
jgi:hypothetical protein